MYIRQKGNSQLQSSIYSQTSVCSQCCPAAEFASLRADSAITTSTNIWEPEALGTLKDAGDTKINERVWFLISNALVLSY